MTLSRLSRTLYPMNSFYTLLIAARTLLRKFEESGGEVPRSTDHYPLKSCPRRFWEEMVWEFLFRKTPLGKKLRQWVKGCLGDPELESVYNSTFWNCFGNCKLLSPYKRFRDRPDEYCVVKTGKRRLEKCFPELHEFVVGQLNL